MFKEKLAEYIDARTPIIYINSYDDNSVDEIVYDVAKVDVWEWSEMYGVRATRKKGKEFVSNKEFLEGSGNSLKEFLIDGVKEQEFRRKIILIKDIVLYLENPEVTALLKSASLSIEDGSLDTTIILVAASIKIPKELEKYVTILREDYLSEDDIRKVITDFQEENAVGYVDEDIIENMAVAFKGLSTLEIGTILNLTYSKTGKLSEDALELIMEQKQQMIQKAGILEMVPVKETLSDIGGLYNLKEWIRNKARVLKDMKRAKEFGVDLPKGVLLAGMPGCGKSLNAKATAKVFGVPLLKLDMGRLMGKYVGESEENMRQAIALAEAISPCVLWVDELEKAFAGIGGSGGGAEVTTRLFGHFLTWMQEKESSVFVVATANDITKLPSELMRKGRFDEVFYVKLPSDDERKKIFEIHIKKRRAMDLDSIDVSKLVELTKGYSGADIEGVVKEAVEIAFVKGQKTTTTDDYISVIKKTHSLKEIMGESLDKLEKEYKDRKLKSAS